MLLQTGGNGYLLLGWMREHLEAGPGEGYAGDGPSRSGNDVLLPAAPFEVVCRMLEAILVSDSDGFMWARSHCSKWT